MTSMFVTDLSQGRRSALKALGTLAAAAVGAAAGTGAAGAATAGTAPGAAAKGAAAARGSGRRGGLDLSNPRDNLYAFGKIWSGYGDEPILSAFQGLMYARIADRRLMPLFGYTGTGALQAKIAPGGDLIVKSRETGYFTDLRSGDILEYWDNPFTGERCEVYHFYNDIVGGRLTDQIPKFLAGGNNESPTLMNEGTVFPNAKGEYPFLLPFQQFGDTMQLSWDYAHEYANPVTPEGWPSYSTGKKVTPSEHFTFSVSRRELEDRSVPSAAFQAGFSRLSQAWPFMRMGRAKDPAVRELTLFGRMHSHKGLKGYGEIPPKVLAYIEKHAPEYLTLPKDWPLTNHRLETWKAFVMDVPPETPGYPWQWAGKERPVSAKPPTGLGARSWKG